MDIAGKLFDIAKRALYGARLPADAFARMRRRRPPAVLRVVEGEVAAGSARRLCVFAHFDRDDVVADYVLHYLGKLSELDLEIVFVSTAERLDGESIARLRPYCRTIILRENIGHDFGSWKVGLERAGDLARYDVLILANDSVYGPIHDLGEVFSRMQAGGYDFWGITESWRIARHLQSYFLVFNGAILRSGVLDEFWRRFRFYHYRSLVILYGEIGLSQMLLKRGFRAGALCAIEQVDRQAHGATAAAPRAKRVSRRADPTRLLWRPLLERQGSPFLKVALLRKHSGNVRDIGQWADILRAISSYDAELIRRHLARLRAAS